MLDIVFILNGAMDQGVFSGGDRHTVGLAEYCMKQGDDVRIVCPEASRLSYEHILNNATWLLTEKGGLPKKFTPAQIPSVLLKYCLRTFRGRSLLVPQCDIIYSGSILPHEVMIAAAWKKKKMCRKFICRCDQVFHNEPFRRDPRYMLHRLASKIGMIVALKCSDLVITMNTLIESQWNDAKSGKTAPIVKTLLYGLDSDLTPFRGRGTKLYDIAFFARVDYVKGADLIPDILACVAKRKPDIKMIIIGDGELTSVIKEKLRHFGITDNVVWQGALNSDERFKLLDQSKILLYPTREDAFPKSVAESMALGLPVIASNNPHLRAVYADVPIFVNTGTPQDYAENILNMLESSELYEKVSRKSLSFASALPPAGNYEEFRNQMINCLKR